MSKAITYTVTVGGNVPALKPAPHTPLFNPSKIEEGCLEAATAKRGWEGPVAYILLGSGLGLVTYLVMCHWETDIRWLQITLGSLSGLLGLASLLYGVGLLSACHELSYDGNATELRKVFFWLKKRQQAEEPGPRFVRCYATKDPRSQDPVFDMDVCVYFAPPVGRVSIHRIRGYGVVREEAALTSTPYEKALQEVHEKADEVAKLLKVDFQHTFTKGPLPKSLRKFFKEEDLVEVQETVLVPPKARNKRRA